MRDGAKPLIIGIERPYKYLAAEAGFSLNLAGVTFTTASDITILKLLINFIIRNYETDFL